MDALTGPPPPTGPGLAMAPPAPGRLGEAATSAELLGYLDVLGRWRTQRRTELDRLDEAALRAVDPDSYTGDITLSMALWQAASDRYDQLVGTWDSGRADRTARDRMSQLIWGRLDTGGSLTGGGLSVSLVEGCRLSDALAAQLRARLSFDPHAADVAVRVTALRAAMERCRELVKREPAAEGQIARLVARLDAVAASGARGGDVTGLLGQLETDSARAERDLIVTTATRRELDRGRDRAAAELVDDRVRATAELTALGHREQAVRELAERCVHQIAVAPRLAVPDVDALGQVPVDRAGVSAFLARLSEVARAMDVADQAYAAPLAERDELRGRLDGYRVMASRTGRDADREVLAAAQFARAALTSVPCDLDSARALVSRYSQLVRTPQPSVERPPSAGGAQ